MRIALVGWMSLVVLCSGKTGLVLCMGADGHLAIKMDYEGHCRAAERDDRHAEHALDAVALSAAPRGDDACVDVAVAPHDALARLHKDGSGVSGAGHFDATPCLTRPAYVGPVCPSSRSGPYRFHLSGISAGLAAHRTVVLRI